MLMLSVRPRSCVVLLLTVHCYLADRAQVVNRLVCPPEAIVKILNAQSAVITPEPANNNDNNNDDNNNNNNDNNNNNNHKNNNDNDQASFNKNLNKNISNQAQFNNDENESSNDDNQNLAISSPQGNEQCLGGPENC